MALLLCKNQRPVALATLTTLDNKPQFTFHNFLICTRKSKQLEKRNNLAVKFGILNLTFLLCIIVSIHYFSTTMTFGDAALFWSKAVGGHF